jgi:hypothetical protein
VLVEAAVENGTTTIATVCERLARLCTGFISLGMSRLLKEKVQSEGRRDVAVASIVVETGAG